MKITETTKPFLDYMSQKLSPKTVKKYEYVLELFLDYLGNYAELPHEEQKGEHCRVSALSACGVIEGGMTQRLLCIQ